MPRALPRELKLRLPTSRELFRLGILAILLLAAMGSTQLLPGASAQEADDATEADIAAQRAADAGDRSNAVSTDQATRPDRSLSVPAVPAGPNNIPALVPTDQVSTRSGRPALPSQLTSAGQDRGQLGTQRLEGTDACDATQPGAGPAICARPLETRAGEFTGGLQPQLSAEQRLLAQQFSGSPTGDATDGAARRLGVGRSADLSNEDLAIASVVTSGQAGQQAPTEDKDTDIPTDATSAIDVILGVINAPQTQ